MTDVRHRDEHHPPPPEPPQRGEPEGSSWLRLAMLALGGLLIGVTAGVSWLLVILGIVLIIFLHELGHFVTARAAGMKCTEFFIGFGPRIWSFHRGETEYGVKAIPAGAYVKVIGMTNLEEVDPEDESRTYRQKPYWRRMSVAVAGSAMHFVLALLCLFALLVGYGLADFEEWQVSELSAIVEVPAGEEPPDPGELPPGPAERAGIEVGDRVVALDGSEVATFREMAEELQDHEPGTEVDVTVERGDETLTIPVTLGDNGEGGAYLGVRQEVAPAEPLSPVEAAPRAVEEFWNASWMSVSALADFFSPSGLSDFFGQAVETSTGDGQADGADTVSSAGENENRVLSLLGVVRLGSQAAEEGLAPVLGIFALVNIFIGLFNLVPLLPLDGGHVAIATYERLRELLSRRHARYHADVAKLLPLTYAVVFVLVGVGLVAFYLDIADPINL